MKNNNYPQKQSNTELIIQNEESVLLEPMSLVELAEVLGGNNDKTEQKKDPVGDKGHAGGLICWC